MKMNLIFGVLSLAIRLTLAGKEKIIPAKVESWISAENFTTIIEKSFLFSICCNIYLSEDIHSVEILLKQFLSIYPYEYMLRRKSYECQGYFLLGPTDEEIRKVMKKVPSSISTTEILIIINGELKSDSKLFNESLYGNSNANIVSKSGIWTLSENYLNPRYFLKVNSYNELIHEFNIVNLKGRELQVCTFYRPPVSYLKTTKNITINGTEMKIFAADNELERDGIEVKIFLIIAEKLNFTWVIQKPEGEYRYGRRIETGWHGGIIELVHKKKVDIAFADIWLMRDTIDIVNMTEPWFQSFIHFLVPRPQPITSFWALTRPFSVEVWMLLLLMLFTKSIYMFGRARLDPKFPQRFRSFLSTITELMGRLLGTWVPRNTAHARLELHLWQTVGVILVTAYSSSLAARLASWEYESRIDTAMQFMQANLSWGRKGKEPVHEYYFDLSDPYQSQLPSRYINVKGPEMIHKLTMTGKYAIIGEIVDSLFFPEDDVANEDLKHYRVMKETMGSFYTSFAVQPWLLKPVNTVILWLKESGIIHFHLGDVIRRRASLNLREVLKEYDGLDRTARTLVLMPLGAGFAALSLGLLISAITFTYELKRAAGSRSIYEVLREIRKKRKSYEQSAHKKKHRDENARTKYNLGETFDLRIMSEPAEHIENKF